MKLVGTKGWFSRLLGSTISRAALAASGVFLFAFALRISNLPIAFADGVPQFPPFDEIYHAKRIAYSAALPFRVLDFDSNRGSHGAFCPWPPLYDMLVGAVARAAGGATAVRALAIATWFPPIVASLAAAVIAGRLARRSLLAGILAGVGVAVSAFFFDKSRLGAIDHHFLEFPLVLAVAASVARLSRTGSVRAAWRDGALLGIALIAGLLVQTATLIAGILAMVALLLFAERKVLPFAGGALGFGLAAGFLVIYRILKPPGYPDDQWYLGYPHAAVLAGAAAACAVIAAAIERGLPFGRAIAAAGAAGAFVLACFPTAAESFIAGSRFFGGDPWFSSIVEFQPLFFPPDSDRFGDFCLLGGGAIVSAAAVFDPGWRAGRRGILLLFTLAYVALAISSMRFLVVGAPLAAVVGAMTISDLRNRGFVRSVWFLTMLLLLPSLALSAGRVLRPPPVLGGDVVPMIKAADFVRRAIVPGRVLAPWSFGHLFNVLTGRGVLMDNFGTVGRQVEFENARGIILSPREKAVANYCRWNGVRFVVLQDPRPYFPGQAETSGFPRTAFARPGSNSPTRLMRSTFWWRAWFEGGRERSGAGPAGSAFRFFRLVAVERERPTDVRPAVQVWEYRPAED